MKSNFKPLGAILQNIVQKHRLENEYRLHKLQKDWDTLVNQQIAKISEPVSMEGKVLTVKVQSDEWRTEINKYSEEMVEIINNNLDDFEVEYINFI